ncbi:MAG: hypothetical protein FWC43_12500 [Planctomycetaceae bacterium]|nr:hypothetical protein [Planctomycetaceae bacterium]
MISLLAQQAVLDAKIVKPIHVHFEDIIDSDWTGTPKILITESETVPEDYTQFNVLSWKTKMLVSCAAKDTADAVCYGSKAANAVMERFAEMERSSNSGNAELIFSAMKVQSTLRHIDERSEMIYSVMFEVIHR